MAVACVVTMNNLFGAGRIAPGLGVVLAAPPPAQPASLVPVIVVNRNSRQVVFVGAASGGLAAAPALARTMAEAMLAETNLDEAIAAPRLLRLADPDAVFVERGLDHALREALAAAGHEVREVPELGRVNAIYCSDGIPANPETCSVATDPRGFGYAVGD
jgi:gamma-glutamyltranspeptidase/glutathione hydrolase